jgi:uncharacterized protein with FMN-binding domain
MRRVVLAVISTVAGLVMLLSFKTHVAQTTTASASNTPPAAVSSTTGGSTSTPSTTASPSPSSTSTRSGSTAAVTKTVTGSRVDTQWGPVQVQITVTNGTVTKAQAVVYPQNNSRDQQINAYAVPTLNQEAVRAGNANIDMVSGATYTSTGYIQSLQSALDKANV